MEFGSWARRRGARLAVDWDVLWTKRRCWRNLERRSGRAGEFEVALGNAAVLFGGTAGGRRSSADGGSAGGGDVGATDGEGGGCGIWRRCSEGEVGGSFRSEISEKLKSCWAG